MHLMPRGHIETNQSTSSCFVTLRLEFSEGSMFDWDSSSVVRSLIDILLLEAIRYPKYTNIAVEFWKQLGRWRV